MSDCEYKSLREHKHFLEILQSVSLYDHTYNVLKVALDIAHEELRSGTTFFSRFITAALGHDIGKIESLWMSSPAGNAPTNMLERSR
jgi:predicted HD phosphohydrolase